MDNSNLNIRELQMVVNLSKFGITLDSYTQHLLVEMMNEVKSVRIFSSYTPNILSSVEIIDIHKKQEIRIP